VDTVFVAAATNLPEMVVTLSAFQIDAVDLAVGNLFGSNLINLASWDLWAFIYVKEPLLQAVFAQHVGTGCMGMITTGIVAAEMMYRPQKKTLFWMSSGAFILVFLYVAHIFVQMRAA
jgi:cation:H+ antiporter